jgi:outer membrane protein assembly factor BamB
MASFAANAGGTRTWRLTSYKDFDEGESTGVLLSSLGEATSGFSATRIDVNESVVYSTAVAADGTVYVGTGDQGVVYVWQKGKLRKLAKLDAVLVASLALGPNGTVFAGTMPGGRVFAIDRDGKVREAAKLDAEHVWSLVYDEGKQTLYAATGPTGRLFAIDVARLDRPAVGRRDRLLYETGEKHLLSLIRSDDGGLLAGSADQAILYKITPTGNGANVQALHDFEGDELRAIARRGATVYVAVNEFQRSSSSSSTTSSTGPNAPRGTKMVLPSTSTPAASSSTSTLTRDRKGRGAVYRVDPDGRVEQLHALADGYFTALYADGDGNVWASSGSNGRVYLIRPDRTVLTALDLPERQVLTLAFDANAQHGAPSGLLGTGDAGALYRVSADPSKDAHYVSRVYDAQFPARWGNLKWGGHGQLTLETRSGNTSHPDKTWSPWTGPQRAEKIGDGDGGVAHVASPPGRYLQIRATFGGARTVLRDLTVYYQPQNQRPRIAEITIGDEPSAHRVSAVARSSKPRSPVVKLRWRVDNPDDDDLIYRLYYREESEGNWRSIGGAEPLTRTEYEWNTESIPDGNYVVKVVASDERSNPREEALEHSLTSTPFLVDNRKPELLDIKVAYPMATGRARDSFSPISELAYSIDGGDWQPFSPKDGIFDDPSEEFSIKLPSGLPKGGHSLAIRAVDAADNVGAVQLTFRVK